jgi:2-polyprenyl-6-methoxyphenol hydroxylase-like FAD-dependent oxidoreductase
VLRVGTPAVRRATFVYSGNTVEVPIKARDGVEALYAPRRTVLDAAIVDTAIEAGVQVSYGTRIVDLIRDPAGRVRGIAAETDDGRRHEIGAGLVIGADGLRSSVARLAGAPATRRGRWAAANVFGYWAGLPVDGYRWYYHPRLSAGAIPTNHGLTCVFASVPAARFAEVFKGDVSAGYHQVLAEVAPDLAERIGWATLAGSLRGFPGQVGYFRRSAGPGWALVGDAAYFKDPITAHGITDALIDAELLARAAGAGTDAALAAYEEARNRRAEALFEVTDRLASFEWTLDEARALHQTLSEAMAHEVRVVNGWAMEVATA